MQVAPALNDENSTLYGPTQLKLQQPAKQGSVLKSSRKAFGNITNSGQTRGSDASAAKPQAKTQPPRRAFGDITNSAAKPPAGPTTAKQQPGTRSVFAPVTTNSKADTLAAPAPDSSQAASAPCADQASSSSSKAECWEGLEPERPAGKTWEQQEAEREAAMEAEVNQSADEICRMIPSLYSFLIPARVDSDDDEPGTVVLPPDVPDLGPTFEPVPDLPSEELELPSDLASLLPDIQWPSDDGDDSHAGSPSAAAAGEVEQLAEAVASMLTFSSADAASCNAAADTVQVAGSLQSPAPPQPAAYSCTSPDTAVSLPW